MRRRLLLSAALCVTGALLATPLRAQSLYFLEADDRPVAPANVTPTSSFRVPPTTFGQRGFFHWDLREWAGCQVPYAITQAATNDASTTPADARIAINNAFNTWQAVSPAIIGYARQVNSATTTAGMDNENLMLWDGGVAANLMALGAPGSGTLALTFIFYDARCRIRESDILFNDVDYQWKNGNNSLSLYTRSANQATFALADGQTLTLRIDGGAVQTITFRAADFADITNATQAEVVAEINGQLAGGAAVQLADGTIGIRSNRVTYDGSTSIEITGGTANGVLGWPVALWLPRGVDVESIALHEIGHFNGIHHTSQNDPEPNPILFNAVMYFLAPPDGTTKRALAPNDVQALNFLYSPDLGDAPDAGLAVVSGSYQSHVHTTLPQGGAAGVLNGVTRFQPGDGPVHLFGFRGPVIPAQVGPPAIPAQDYSGDRFEWLGPTIDGSANECEALIPNLDASDDGVTFAAALTKGKKTRIRVLVNTSNSPGRYALNESQRLNLNGYIDFNGDTKFTPADLQFWWAGIPSGTVAGGTMTQLNLVPALSDLSVNPMVLVFDVPVPPNAPDNTWARVRLDFGEDEGRNAALPPGGWEGNLAPATGEAQFGEVEDYPVESSAQRIVSFCVADTLVAGGETATRTFCFGNAEAIPKDVCYSISDGLGWIAGASQPLSGQQFLPPDVNFCVGVQVEPPIDCTEGEADTLRVLVWPCDDPAAADTCIALVRCAGATPTLLSQFTGRTGADFAGLTYWLAEDGDVSGVVVYRATAASGPFVRVTQAPIPVTGQSKYDYTDHDLAPATTYYYQLGLIGRDGVERRAGRLELRTQSVVFSLGRPSPNPTSAGFRVLLSVPKAGPASVRLLDVSGRAVRTVFRGTLEAGEHTIDWDGRRDDGGPVANGVYYLVYDAAGRRAVHPVIVTR